MLAAILLLSRAACAAGNKSDPSIILISIDTLRADRLSCYGYQQVQTPHIDALAKGGTLFSAISAQIPLTLPSHASLFTSNYPFTTGAEENVQQLQPNSVTLATALKARGYRTGAFVGGFVMDRRFGLSQGFDVYDSPFDLRREEGKDPGDIKRLGEEVVRAATGWLEQKSEKPFFLFLHLYDLHTPYNLPPAHRRRYGGNNYLAELRYADDLIGRFTGFLVQRGIFDKVLLVFCSDHGESLGEHGETTHGYFIYQSTLWVPLIIHWPSEAGSFPARLDQPASLLDVTPTILEFTGFARPTQFQGRGLMGLVKRAPGEGPREVYSESIYARSHFGCSSLFSLRVGRYKYIEAPQRELYDLKDDPHETHNLYKQKQSVAMTLRERLMGLRSRFPPERPAPAKPLDPETIARLSSLGYVAVSSPQSAGSESGTDPKDRIGDYEEYGHAIALAGLGRLEESNSLLERLLAKHPDLLDPRASLGLNRQKQGRHAEAAKEFLEILKKDPLNAQAHFNLAVSYVQLQKLDEATKALQVALALAPTYTRAEELLGTICLRKGDDEHASLHFRHILEVDPLNFTAHYNLGVLATLQKLWQEGEIHLRAALQVDPADADAHNTLGSLYLERGDLTRANKEFRAAIASRPKFAWAHYNLGLVLRRQNLPSDAEKEFRQAILADPHFQPAREALNHLPQTPN